jgi:putative DNA primase/helicase
VSSRYGDAWRPYLAAGYAPLPLPPKEKHPPPFGWTGGSKANSGKLPDKGQCETWEKNGFGPWKAGNIALRLPVDVIGIDVDMYEDKEGRASLAAAEERWGPLPVTAMSSSRSDGSGIRLFTVPAGLAWASEIGSGIEIIRWDHRYAVVFPSVHPNGAEYLWLASDTLQPYDRDWLPGVDELGALPDAWVEGLTNGRTEWKRREEAELTPDEVTSWLDARENGTRCAEMTGTVGRGVAAITKGGKHGGLHEAGLTAVWGVLRDAAHGHAGVRDALADLRKAFLDAAKKRSKGRKAEAQSEWFRIVGDGVRKTAAEVKISAEDSCAALGEMDWNAETVAERDIPHQYYPLTDIGNAQRMGALYGEDIRWNPGDGRWLVWRGVRWEPDRTGLVEVMAKKVADYVEHTEAATFDGEDTERFKALRAHAKALGKRANRGTMLEDTKSMRGVTVLPEELDADLELLQCGTRLVRLGPEGATVRLPRREDYQTLTAGTDFCEGSSSALWEGFLKRSMPDEDVRSWVQKAVGYSLFGGNPERLIFFLKGPTSTGKSVFAEVLSTVLGEYAGVFDMTLFRSQKEQGPNVQLVRLLDKRVIFSSETSEERFLHADQLKRVTGGDTMSARLNRSNDMVTKRPAFTAWIMTNHAPTIRGADNALYRRLRCIPFEQEISIEEQQSDLVRRLTAGTEASAVLGWAIDGWTAYAREGLNDIPRAVILSTMQLRGELSEFNMWMEEECEPGADARTPAKDLYSSYSIWCEENGVERESAVKFGRLLSANGYQRVLGRKGESRNRLWKGIKLK